MWDCDTKSGLNGKKKKSCWAWRFKVAQTDFRGVFIPVRSQRFLLLTLSRESFVLGWANTRSSQEKLNLHLNPLTLGSTYGCGRSHRETDSGVRGGEKHTIPLHGHAQPPGIQPAAEIMGHLMKVCLFFFLLELQPVRSWGCEFIKDQLIKSLGLHNFHSYLQGQSAQEEPAFLLWHLQRSVFNVHVHWSLLVWNWALDWGDRFLLFNMLFLKFFV